MAGLGSTVNIVGFPSDSLPRVLNGAALNTVTRLHPTLRAMIGRSLGDAGEATGLNQGPKGMPAMERLSYHDGNKFRRRFMGRTVPSQLVSKNRDATGQFASHTPSYVQQRYSDEFDLAQVTTVYDVPKRDYDFLPQTEPTVTQGFLMEDLQGVAAGMIELIAPLIHGSSDSSDVTICGWQKALGTTGTCQGIDYTDGGNANHLATQYSSFGSATIGKFNRIATKALKRGGIVDFLPMGETDYGIAWDVIQGEVTYDQNTEVMGILSKWPVFQGMRFCNDPYMESAYAAVTTGSFPALDTSKVWMHFSKVGFKGSELTRNPTVVSGLIQFIDCYLQAEYAPMFHVNVSGMTA